MRVILLAIVGSFLVAALTQAAGANCPQDLNELNAILERERTSQSGRAAAELRNLREVAQRLQSNNDVVGCTRVAQQGLALWRRMSTVELAPTQELIGRDVVDTTGQKIGSIRGLIVDITGGQIAFAIVRMGGFLGIGTREHAVPWRTVTRTPNDQSLTLSIPRARLETAPRFDIDAWNDVVPIEWATSIFTYFGVEPYWEAAAREVPLEPRDAASIVSTRLDALAKDIQDMRGELAQAREASREPISQIVNRLDALSKQIDQIEQNRPVSSGSSSPTPGASPETSSGAPSAPEGQSPAPQ
ncbi:MAG TPA: PRC-barrel domain-containing protein [Alphaproteobacteria bacterium]